MVWSCKCRLPASSGAGVGEATWAAGGNRVVPTTHAKSDGIVLVAVGFVEAREGHMSAMWAETVGPAVVHLATLDGDVTPRSGRQCSWRSNSCGSHNRSAGRCVWERGADGVVSAMIAGVAGGEAANPLLVAENKVCFKDRKRPFGEGAKTKVFSGGCQEISFLNYCKCKRNDCDVGKRDITERGNALNVCNLCPEIFNGCIKVPGFG